MRKILVVEDEYAIRDLISINLLSAGYDVVTVDSGERALETIGADPNSFDVALLDIMLPGIISPSRSAPVSCWRASRPSAGA